MRSILGVFAPLREAILCEIEDMAGVLRHNLAPEPRTPGYSRSGSPELFRCRLIVDPPAAGAWNMAVDESLLLAAAEENVATLRFYEWLEPTLSLGYFQRYEERCGHAASRQCAVVRRQSGGGAILHDRELTYSLALPAGHPLAQNSPQLYAAVHEAIVRRLAQLLSESNSASTLSLHCPPPPRPGSPQSRPDREPFLCFQRRAPGDVVLSTKSASANATLAAPNWKIVGSAQRRHRGAILQHGSVLLARSPAAPELPGFCDVTWAVVAASNLASALSTEVGQILGLPVGQEGLPASLAKAAREIVLDKYGSDSWTRRR
jgi:lipoate-protein ligase A